ncbi:MAG TPA: BTAD domain-containing putative transcriptional regulator [Streptosporangiaceae bacterium]|nr:BTAD domain-containing putative transcriptional regulator [Streptosporangiaceae bacterium]
MEFGLLGPLVVRDGTRLVSVSAPQQRILLAALLLNAGRVVSVDALAEVLWEDGPPAGARGALHSAVQRLRVALGPSGADLIETQPPGYLITVGDGELDVLVFSMLVARGHAAAEAGRWAQAAGLLREALGLWRGEPLADVPSELLRDREMPPLEDQRLQALAARIDADLLLGRHGEVVAELRQLVAAYPLQEQFHAQLMLSLYRSGRQADALAAYQDVRGVLADELGIDPGPDVTQLHQRILAADRELLLAGGGEPPGAEELSLPAPAREPGAVRSLLVPRQLPAATRHFAGRAESLKVLAELAAETAGASPATVIVVIDGTAGIGKTTLALHFAHQAAAQFPDGQLYVNLRGFDPAAPPMSPAEAVRLLLDGLGVPSPRIPAGLDAQAGLYRSVLAGRRMLVLLDNARDVDQVRPLLPASPGCLAIVTSRSQLTSLVAAEGAFPLTLDVLPAADAHELLARRLGAARIAAEPAAADELIQLCAALPLALSIAAARSASHPGLSLAALTAELRDAGGRLDALDAGHAATNVRAVLSWSYQQLNAGAGRLFRLLGLHPGPDVSAAAAASLAGQPLPEARRELAELTRAHLLAEHVPGRFSSHDLLRAYAAELTRSRDTDAERRAATGRMLDHYLHTAAVAAQLLDPTRSPVTLAPADPGAAPEPVRDIPGALAWFHAERRVLMAAIDQAGQAGFDTQAWQLPWALSIFLETRGRWHDWVAIEQTALAAAQRLGDLPAQAGAHQRYGYASGRVGNFRAADIHLGHALDIHIKLGDLASQAYVHNALAITEQLQGRHGEALRHAEQALALYTAAGDRSGRALALNSVGWFHALGGDSQQALTYCQQALELSQELGHQEGVASVLDSLGYAHQQGGDYAQATGYFQRAADLYREIGGRWGLSETLDHLGDAQQAAGAVAAARAAWAEALAILDDLGHPDAAEIQAKLQALGS